MKSRLFAALLSFALLLYSAQGQSYKVTDLGAGLGAGSHAQSINNKGQVVGYWRAPDGMHAFLYDSAVVKDLGNLGGTNIYALSINDSGQVAGVAETVSGMQAFVYQNGSLTSLGTLGGINSYAHSINNLNQIVGYIDTPSGAHAYVYRDGAKIELGTLGGTNSFGYSVNTNLQVAGTSLTFDNRSLHAFFWQTNAILDLNRLLAAPSGWELQEARAINESGQIVGSGILDDREHAFLFNAGAVVDIGVLPGGTNSYALGVNNKLEVVGASSTSAGLRAFMWHGGSMLDLNNVLNLSPDWELLEASGINDLGQVVGLASVNGQEHAFLLSPVTVSDSSVQDGKSQKSGIRPRVGGSLTVTITNPAPTAVFSIPTNVTICADASDSVGTVTQVQFFAGTTLLGNATTNPYTVTWSNATVGTYSLTAVAFDDASLSATSSVVNVTVTLPTPSAIKFWLRADAGTILNGNTVATWQDQSGNSVNATQTVPANQPVLVTNTLNGLPVVRFDGASSYLNLPYTSLRGMTQGEIFVVLKAAADESGIERGWWMLGSGDGQGGYPRADGTIRDGFGSTTTYTIGNPAQSLDQFHLYNVSAQTNDLEARVNGALQYQNLNNVVQFWPDTPTIGQAYYYFAGDMAEVLMFNRVLSSAERDAVNGYLNSKYALVTAAPLAPTNLVSTAVSSSQVSLTWGFALGNISTSFSIERKTGAGGTYAQVTIVQDATSYVDTNLTAGTQYYYRVMASSFAGRSGYSNEATATTPGSGTDMPLGSLKLWLKGDTGVVHQNTNGTVGTWFDQSGSFTTASQSTPANQPVWVDGAVNGRPVVRFDGASSYLNLPYTSFRGMTQAEVFVVVKAAADHPTGERGWWMLGIGDGTAGYPRADGTIHDNFGTLVTYNIGDPAQPVDQYHLYNVSAMANDWEARINGVLQYQNLNNSVYFWPDTPTLGRAYYYFAGDMAEVLIFNRTLASTERQAVNGYLNGKYGLVPIQPAAPTNLVANAISPTQVNLTWSNTTTVLAGVQIERKTDIAGTYAVIAEVGVGVSSYSDMNPPSGHRYFYRVRASNLAGYSPYSNEAGVTINQLPSVTLTTPTNGSVFVSPANIPLAATASDTDGTVTNVTFLLGGTTNLGSVGSAPFTTTWSNVLAGAYVLSASATDNLGGVTTSTSVNVVVSNPPPSVTLTAPTNNQFYLAPAIITLTANASDPNGTVAKVDFYFRSTNLIGTATSSPYSLQWTNLATGSYPLTAVATDNEGATSTSAVVNISVSNSPPTVSITSPTNNTLFQALATIPITANAADANGTVAKVEYFYGGTNKIGEAYTSPFSVTWSNVVAGTNLITAKATDNGGASTTSSAISVIINAQPTVSITNPVNNASFAPGSITINATAADSDGTISKVDFYYGLNNLIGTDTSSPYSIVLSSAPFGTFPLTAKATDNRGGVTVSSPVTVSVGTNLSDFADSYVHDGTSASSNFGTATSLLVETNGTAGNNSDTYFKFNTAGIINVTSARLNIYAAVSNTKDTLGVTACGTSTNWTETGITWNNRPALGAIIASTNISGKTFAWYTLDVTSYVQAQKAAGSNVFSLALHATNSTSGNVSLNSKEATANRPYLQLFASNNPPTVTISSPTNYAFFTPGTNISISASASDADGSIFQVQFFQGTTSLGIKSSPPYTVTWTNAPPGAYALTAVATDNYGASTTSGAIYVIVQTNPYVSDSDGDGIPDAWEAMFGLNPTVNDLGQSGERSNYSYTPADWFNQVSGVKTGTVNLDNEGNVLQVSQ
jgi:probable HAF family extracellular repeat protein